MLNFCTLFDSNYIRQGLALHDSLQKHCTKFHLYIFAFDDLVERILRKLSLKNITIISLKEFEDQKLLEIKPSRTKGEYCWTCTSSAILYVLKNFAVDSCTYLDADIYFFSDPKILIGELKEKSVLITNHNYAPEYDQSQISGKYCVQFVTFKNNAPALEVLEYWRDACIKWCYNRAEDGKFGDQKYLDEWPEKFDCVYELKNYGGGIAPWNCTKYEFYLKDNQVFVKDYGRATPLVFYHFHSLKFLQNNITQLAAKNYKISPTIQKLIYHPYIKNIATIEQKIARDITFSQTKIELLKIIKIKFFKTHKNLVNKKYFLKYGAYN